VNGFGDIGRMVTHALKILYAKHQVGTEGSTDRTFHHVSKKLLRNQCTVCRCLDLASKLDRDPELFQNYFNWKKEPLRPRFVQLVERQQNWPTHMVDVAKRILAGSR